jgi:hypothetical protein
MYIIMGVPGAGKSTVINKFMEKHKEWEVINYGTLMFEIAKKFGIENRDDMRKSDLDLQKKIQARVGEELSKISKILVLAFGQYKCVFIKPPFPENKMKEEFPPLKRGDFHNTSSIVNLLSGNAKLCGRRRYLENTTIMFCIAGEVKNLLLFKQLRFRFAFHFVHQ